MGVTVIVNNRTVVHKDSSGKAPATPDFCKTPAPPGPPVPVPYVIMAQSSSTADGSTSVKMDGKPIMLKNSKFDRCSGDEAGTLKGVASNTNMGCAKFANYSFDVKVEDKNVPRLGDPMTNNGNAANGLTPAELQALAAVMGVSAAEADAICDAICANYTPNKLNPNAPKGSRGKGTQKALDAKGIGRGEQTQWLPNATGTAAKGRTAAGTFQSVLTRAGNVARSSTGCGVGNTVRWDRNVNGKWIEFKGDKEGYTDNQQEAINQSGGKQPDATVRPKDCGCDEV